MPGGGQYADRKAVIYSFRSSNVSLLVSTERFLSRAIAGASHEHVWCVRGTFTTRQNDPEGSATMRLPPDSTPRVSAPAFSYRYVFAVVVVGAVLALHPAPPRLVGAPLPEAHELVLSDQARRSLALEYRASPTELMGCMIGEVYGSVVRVQRIAPADVDPAESTPTRVRPRRTCEAAGWVGTVGTIHNHPGGERCFYYFPGTQVPSSDAQSFGLQAYPVDAILCGDSIVWINGASIERHVSLAERRVVRAPDPPPGNRLRAGSRVSLRGE